MPRMSRHSLALDTAFIAAHACYEVNEKLTEPAPTLSEISRDRQQLVMSWCWRLKAAERRCAKAADVLGIHLDRLDWKQEESKHS